MRRDVRAAIARGQSATALALLSQEPELPEIDRLTLAAEIEIASQRWAAARRLLREALAANPDDPRLLFMLGQAHAAGGAHVRACEQFERAAQRGLQTAALHLAWAQSLNELEKPLDRARVIDATADTTVGQWLPQGVVVQVQPQAGRALVAGDDTSFYHALKALTLEPDLAAAARLCGDLWNSIGEHRLAISSYESALPRLDERSQPSCLEALADAYLETGDVNGYFRCVRLRQQVGGGLSSEQTARRYEQVAETAAERGELDQQIRYLTLAAEVQESPERHVRLGDALALAGRAADAAAHWRRALEMRPDHAERARIEAKLERFEVHASSAP